MHNHIYIQIFLLLLEKEKQKKILKEFIIILLKQEKNGKYGINEFENEISEDEYDKLSPLKEINEIIKDRYYIPLSEELTIELDVFKGIFEGIIYAEVEFKDEDSANKFQPPAWFDKELTGKVSNAMMSKITRKELDDILLKI